MTWVIGEQLRAALEAAQKNVDADEWVERWTPAKPEEDQVEAEPEA